MNFDGNVVIGFCNIFIYSKHVEITDNNYDATAEFLAVDSDFQFSSYSYFFSNSISY